jgi:hypothetical protein
MSPQGPEGKADRDFDGQALDVEIGQLRWRPVLLKGEPFPWHRQAIPSARARETIAGPQVYRWTMRDRIGAISGSYIGETGEFVARLCAYRSGKSDREASTVRAAMRRCEGDGGMVELCFLDLEKWTLRVNGKLTTNRSLADHDVRLMLEKTAILTARVEGIRVLNDVRENVLLKNLRQIAQKYPEVRGLITEEIRVLLAATTSDPP